MGRLVEYQIQAGVHGLAVLGVMGEADTLASSERQEVVRTVVKRAADQVSTLVGVRAFGTMGAIEQAHEAQELGASAVFVAPLATQDDAVLFGFYQSVAAALRIPVMIHDFPESFTTTLGPSLIARLALETEHVRSIKLEDPPTGVKLSKIRALAGERIAIVGGLGGLYCLEELERGASGIMTGFAFPEVLVGIYEHFNRGDGEEAARIFDRYCPLLRYEFQPKIGLALRKYSYHRRGIIASSALRLPGATLDAHTSAELERTVERVHLSLRP
jgi:4-hydroxy-tetrahydrodipicolinate synthase